MRARKSRLRLRCHSMSHCMGVLVVLSVLLAPPMVWAQRPAEHGRPASRAATSDTSQTPAPAPEDTAGTPDVPFAGSPPGVVAQMLELARVNKEDVVYDLGSGDGRIVIAAAQRCGARGIGFDLDPELVAQSRRNADSAGVADRVQFFRRDLFTVDLREATVVTLYLFEEINVKLRPKLLTELRPGTRIVSHDFGMGDWKPDSTVWVASDHSNVHLWVIPAMVGGTWTLTQVSGKPAGDRTGRRSTVRLAQQYQRVTGTAAIGERRLAVTSGHLAGDRITFTLADTAGARVVMTRFSGRISGNRMSGTVTTDANAERGAWSAVRAPS